MDDKGLPARPGRLMRVDLGQQAFEAIKMAILDSEFAPGQVLNSLDVAAWLGVSRTPVRQALQLLAQHGFVEPTPRGQFVVRQLSKEDISEVFLIRAGLESLAIRTLMGRKTEKTVRALETLVGEQEVSGQMQDRARFLLQDGQFHLTIAEEAGLPRVAALLEQVRDLILLLGGQAVTKPGRIEAVIAEHRAIVAAIQQNEPTRAVDALRRHLTATAESIGVDLGSLMTRVIPVGEGAPHD